MKNLLWTSRLALYFIACLLIGNSCVNKLETVEEVKPGKTPIQLSYSVQRYRTRATENTFEKGDRLGLCAYFHEGKNQGKEYIKNATLHCTNDKQMVPETTLFYPEKGNSLDFFAYYPYQEKIDYEKKQITISTPYDQSRLSKLDICKFLVSKAEDIRPSDESVKLKFKHALSKVKITIKLEQPEYMEKLTGKNSDIILSHIATKGNYNISDGSFTDLDDYDDMLSNVPMVNKNGTLTGPCFCIIPQKLNDGNKIYFEWNGRNYSCDLPITELKGGYQYEIIISSLLTESKLMTGTIGEIEEWETAEEQNTNNQAEFKEFHLRTMNLTESHVYRIYRDGMPVAEVCNEWLNHEGNDSNPQLVVALYPVRNNKTILTEGILLAALNSKEKIFGGKISWNKENNTYTLEKGNKGIIRAFCLNDKNEMIFDRKQAVNIDVIAEEITDIRNGVITKYPMIKIGTQYWMTQNLRATHYTDNQPIPEKSTLDNSPGYMTTNNKDILYNGYVFNHKSITPKGWKIPTAKEWKTLLTFTNNNLAPLVSMPHQKSIDPNYSNWPLLFIKPTGIWERNSITDKNSKTGFWCASDDNTGTNSKCVIFNFTTDSKNLSSENIFVDNKNMQKGLAIRCIKIEE